MTDPAERICEIRATRLAVRAAEHRRRMEQVRRTPSIPLNACTCGRPAVLAVSNNPGRFEVYCEGYWDAEGWSCPEGRCTDEYTETQAAEEAWNAGRANMFGLANS